MNIDDLPKVIGDDGEFHATDAAVDLSDTPIEAWFALALFWALAGVVFTQFFTRYALNKKSRAIC
jgi:TRAP-type transport system small permease protein